MAYRIIDEPPPSVLRRFVLNPFWIVLAGMVLPRFQPLVVLVFAFNSVALRGPTLKAEFAWLLAAVALVAGYSPLVAQVVGPGLFTVAEFRAYAPYFGILYSALILMVFYRVYLYQIESYQLLRYESGLRA